MEPKSFVAHWRVHAYSPALYLNAVVVDYEFTPKVLRRPFQVVLIGEVLQSDGDVRPHTEVADRALGDDEPRVAEPPDATDDRAYEDENDTQMAEERAKSTEAVLVHNEGDGKIGRASCRERV